MRENTTYSKYVQISAVSDINGYPNVTLRQIYDILVIKLTEGVYYWGNDLKYVTHEQTSGFWSKKEGENAIFFWNV